MAAHPETSRRGAFSHDVEQRQRMATGTAPADSAGGCPPLISIEYRVHARLRHAAAPSSCPTAPTPGVPP